ncbi:extracellular solute-binding protein [Paracoccus sp. (in: a-proteobacteria)]|uniref:extracellular solute-binding protein n=1 Tax=Paracoccus sp. TaxID=267 RepID=UPI0028ADBF62|nr:extracellular solute-binding protein [Paracoccus sp. (in: a-proteobacteria)]
MAMESTKFTGIMLSSTLALLAGTQGVLAEELNLYTTREPGLIQPLIDAFTQSTGVTVNTIFLQDGIAERVIAEGDKSPADVLMTVDAGVLVDLVEKELTQSIESEALTSVIPATLRDDEGHWFALSMRARAVYAATDLDLTEITYEQLADPEWKGRVCIRSGLHPYNVALTGSFIAHHGEEAAKEWLTGLKANLARPAAGGDRDVARDIMGDLCDIGVANSYYVGLMRSGAGGPEQEEWAKGIRMILPTFENGGTQVNITGAAVARHAPNKDQAVRFLEYLVSDEAQAIYAQANFEYPVNANAAVDPLIAEYGALTPDTIDIVEGVKFRAAASQMAEQVGFDN